MVTVATSGLPRLTLLGNELFAMLSIKDSFFSRIVSLIIGTLNETLVTLAVNVMLYGPDL